MNSLSTTLEIMLTTRIRGIHEVSRRIAYNLIIQGIVPRKLRGSEIALCIEFEIDCWMDGLTLDALPPFCTMLSDATKNGINTIAILGDAWTEYAIPPAMRFSPLVAALSSTRESTADFSSLTTQVATRCLLFQRNPIPMAAICSSSLEGNSSTTQRKNRERLVSYAKFLLAHKQDHVKALDLLCNLLGSSLAPGNPLSVALTFLCGTDPSIESRRANLLTALTFDKSFYLARFLIHVCLLVGNAGEIRDRCWVLLRQITPTLLLVSAH